MKKKSKKNKVYSGKGTAKDLTAIKELEDSLTEIGEKEYNLDYYEKLVKDILTSESPEEQNVEEAYREHTDIRQ